jgi:hypothetical protein
MINLEVKNPDEKTMMEALYSIFLVSSVDEQEDAQ